MKDKFFGRESYLELLRKRIGGLKEGYRQNLAILGDELVGKSSIIYRFLDKFFDTRILILYVEARPESLSSFSRRFIGILLYNFLANSDISLRENLDFLMDKSEKYIPRTVGKVKEILSSLEKRKKNNIFTDLLSLCEGIHEETGKFCVIVLDEFHNLASLGIKNLYKEWSKLIILQKTTLYIVISSMKYRAKTILSKDLSLLFGNFETISVEPFDIRVSELFLKERLGHLDLNKGNIDFIVHFTGGSPFYLELISSELIKSPHAPLAEILQGLLFEPSGILNQRFSNYLKRFFDSVNSQDYVTLLYLISSGNNKLKDIAHILHKSKKELMVRIAHLLELDTINRSGDFLSINDRVFGFWLKFVYREKMQSLTFDAKNQKALFKERIEEMIREFLISAQKPVLERMMELLRLFEDETIQVERKKLRLEHFREIKPLFLNGRGLKDGLIGRSSDSLWIMAFKSDFITEEDISDFAKECKKYRHKLQRKIIIAFQDIDANARLRALEEKIWTWDLDNVNRIFDLYSRPRIVI